MSADILPFPDRAYEFPTPAPRETTLHFIARMSAEARKWYGEPLGGPSAAAIFLEAAARRLHQEALADLARLAKGGAA